MKKKAIEIELHRAEGRHEECIKVRCTAEKATTTGYDGKEAERPYYTGTWATDPWTRANAVLASWSHTAPKTGGYDKCDFKVTYEDGETYEGRYDLTHMDRDGYPSIEKHMTSFIGCYSGRRKPAHLKDADYRRFLAFYEKDGTCESYAKFEDAYEIGLAREEKAA